MNVQFRNLNFEDKEIISNSYHFILFAVHFYKKQKTLIIRLCNFEVTIHG